MRVDVFLVAALVACSAPLAAAQSSPVSFQGNVDFLVGISPVGVASGDFNADGKSDLVTANYDDGDISVLLGQGDGTFMEPPNNFGVGGSEFSSPSAVAVGDMNGDGMPDIVATDDFDDNVSVLLNQGSPTPGASSGQVLLYPKVISSGTRDVRFDPAIVTATGSSPEAVVIADFNKDGEMDVATADNGDNTVAILLGTGDGHFSTVSTVAQAANADDATLVLADASGFPASGAVDVNGTAYAYTGKSGNTLTLAAPLPAAITSGASANFVVQVGADPFGLAAADLDGDGNVDLVVTNSDAGPQNTGTITVLKGMGDGTFVAQPEISSDTFDVLVAVTVADLNGDSKPDLAVVNEEGDSVSVLLNTGDLTFPNATAYAVGGTPEAAVVADFNGDGIPDIADADSFDDTASVLLGAGDGTFAAATPLDVGTTPVALVAADFNGDQLPDLATANYYDDTVSVLLNETSMMPTVCAGDCNADQAVTINEIIALVNIVLGNQPTSACASGIPPGANPNVGLIIQAVNNVLNGTCTSP